MCNWTIFLTGLWLTSISEAHGRRVSSPSTSATNRRHGDNVQFIPLGRWSLGGALNDMEIHDARLCSSGSLALHEEIPSICSPLDTTILASATTAKAPTRTGLGKFLPLRCGKTKKGASSVESTEDGSNPSFDKAAVAMGAALPLIPDDVWVELTGDEYDDPLVVDALAQTGLIMATKHTNNGWVEWKQPLPSNLDASLDDGEILVFTGATVKQGFGSEVPWIKSMSIVPMAPSELAELMMDSSRVKTYNSLSLGREDVKVIQNDGDKYSPEAGNTKIVRNIVQLPVTNSKVESVTLLHTRELDNGAHLLISRAIGGTRYFTGVGGKSYILLGVNLFEPTGDLNECRMTAINHVYSPGVPLMVAGKVGAKSAKNFVKDIRSLCVPVM